MNQATTIVTEGAAKLQADAYETARPKSRCRQRNDPLFFYAALTSCLIRSMAAFLRKFFLASAICVFKPREC